MESFLASRFQNQWVWWETFEVYLRKGRRVVDQEIFECLQVANFSNKDGDRERNVHYDENHTRTGLLKRFDDHLKELVGQSDLQGIYYENVINEFLPDVLVRYGYRSVNNQYGEYNFWWSKDERS